MKKLIFTILMICVVFSATAQHRRMPKYFRNTSERRHYEARRPGRSVNQNTDFRFAADFDARLDSVIGANDFDWTQWKTFTLTTKTVNGQAKPHTNFVTTLGCRPKDASSPTMRMEIQFRNFIPDWWMANGANTTRLKRFTMLKTKWIQSYIPIGTMMLGWAHRKRIHLFQRPFVTSDGLQKQ